MKDSSIDATNRVFVIGIALLWMFVALVVIMLAWGAPDETIDALADFAGWLEDNNNSTTKLIITFGGLIFVLLGALVVVLEVMPPEAESLKVTNIRSGQGQIGTDEVTARLEEEVRALPQIANVQAMVRGRGDKAEIDLELHVRPEADLAATTEEACRVARHLVSERMGIQLERDPSARLHYRELVMGPNATSANGPAAQQPATAQPPAPAASQPAPSPSVPSQPAPEVQTRHDISEQRPEDRTA
jgi:hypothetical protein